MTDRHQFRADWHDYDDGVYFVTICSDNKRHIFGHIADKNMYLNKLGRIIESCIKELPAHSHGAEVCNYVIMPNHIHMVISVGTRYIASASTETEYNPKTQITPPKSNGCLKPPKHSDACKISHHNSRLAVIIGSFKAAVTRKANRYIVNSGRDISRPYWQTRYHEHIIRNQRSFENIMTYIDNNVTQWDADCFNKTEK